MVIHSHKVATNSALTKRMGDIIDIDCGPIVEGDKIIEQMGEEVNRKVFISQVVLTFLFEVCECYFYNALSFFS